MVEGSKSPESCCRVFFLAVIEMALRPEAVEDSCWCMELGSINRQSPMGTVGAVLAGLVPVDAQLAGRSGLDHGIVHRRSIPHPHVLPMGPLGSPKGDRSESSEKLLVASCS